MAESAKLSPPRDKIPRNPIKLFRMACYNPLVLYMAAISFMFSMASFTYVSAVLVEHQDASATLQLNVSAYSRK